MAYYSGESQKVTQKEKTYLEDALQMENLALSKYSVYADQCQDPELSSLFFSISKTKREHANRIKDLLNNQGLSNQQYQ